MKNNGNVRMIERCFFTGLPGPKIMKKAKFGHKWFQKRSSHKNERRPNEGKINFTLLFFENL